MRGPEVGHEDLNLGPQNPLSRAEEWIVVEMPRGKIQEPDGAQTRGPGMRVRGTEVSNIRCGGQGSGMQRHRGLG